MASTQTKKKPATTNLASKMEAAAMRLGPTPDMLAAITTRANELLQLMAKRDEAEQMMQRLEGEILTLEQVTLPALMDEAQITVLGLENDQLLQRGEDVYASISKDNAPLATQWLIDNGYGSIVRTKVLVELEKDDIKLLKLTRTALMKAHIAFEESSAVNAATLRAFVKERLEAGTKLPQSITVHVQPRVTVKVPRKKASKTPLVGV